jgi:hypothetical protein
MAFNSCENVKLNAIVEKMVMLLPVAFIWAKQHG